MRLVAFEGIDGAGKTTVRAHLAARVRSEMRLEVWEGGEFMSPFGDALQASLPRLSSLEKALLFAADRSISLRAVLDAVVRPDLLLWDRYVASAYAYRWAECRIAGENVDPRIMEIVEIANRNFPEPDVYIYLEIDAGTSLSRIGEQLPVAVIEAVPAGYERFFASAIRKHVLRVDATRSIEDVVDQCFQFSRDYGII